MPSRVAVVFAAATLSCSRGPGPDTVIAATATPPPWPGAGAILAGSDPVESGRDGDARRWRIYVDAGHGADGNAGTQSAICEQEETFTLRVANDLAQRLPELGPFDVLVSRDGTRPVSYPSRIEASSAWKADAFVAIHMDARGTAQPWLASPGQTCWRQDAEPGFSVLWSSEGERTATSRRQTLARAIAARMKTAGFLPYDGRNYPGHYASDPGHDGVFENRPGIGRRIYLLRKPRMPAVIIETHHGLDLEELTRWREPRTLEVFAATVAAGLLDALDSPKESAAP